MTDNRWRDIRISPEVLSNKLFTADFFLKNQSIFPDEVCCNETTTTTTVPVTGFVLAYSSLQDILSGGTNGNSLLTGLTIPILLTETAVDIGFYSVFDGFVLQKDVMTNFLVSGDPLNSFNCYLYNTSEIELKKYLAFTTYTIDWGDGTTQLVPSTSPTSYLHNYSQPGEYTITMSGANPWGLNIIKKEVRVPFTGVTIDNPNGTAYFIPQGGSWSGTPLMYDYLFSGDSYCDIENQTGSTFTDIPILISGYSLSNLSDLQVYGSKNDPTLYDGKYKLGVQVTGTTGLIGTFWGTPSGETYTAYTINDIDYYDYPDGNTLFITYSSGLTSDWLVCSAITKNEYLLNVIDEAEIQSDVFIERGKNSVFEYLQRLGEVDNVGDLVKYGYSFFKINKIE